MKPTEHILKRITAGEDLPKEEIENALCAHAAANQLGSEAEGQSLARLIGEGDTDTVTLSKALEAARRSNTGSTRTRLIQSAEAVVDEFVKAHTGPNETTAAAYARLAVDKDEDFTRAYEHLTECRDLQQ